MKYTTKKSHKRNNRKTRKRRQKGGAFKKEDILKNITVYNQDTSVYTMVAHGCDIPGEPIPIPMNCVYVTFALCTEPAMVGQNSIHKKLITLFDQAKTDKKVAKLLRNPVANASELTNKLTTNQSEKDSIHIHAHGQQHGKDTYLDSTYSVPLGWAKRPGPSGGARIMRSGLFKMGDNLFVDTTNTNILKYGTKTGDVAAQEDAKDGQFFSIDTMRALFKDSLYPTGAIVEDLIPAGTKVSEKFNNLEYKVDIEDKLNNPNYLIKQSELFQYWPGVHYNFVCRVDCQSPKYEPPDARLRLRRAHSLKEVLATGVAQKTFDEVDLNTFPVGND